MDEDDYTELINFVLGQLAEVGTGDLANSQLYDNFDEETGERRDTSQKDRLIEMLRAFDRHLAIFDRGTYIRAVENINQELEDGHLEGAVFLPASERGSSEPCSLGDAPMLEELRLELNRLIRELGDGQE